MATLNKEDPLLNVTGLVKHIYQFKEDAYLALKMAITRLREPHRTRFVTESLTQAMDFCTIHHLLSKLAPLDYRRLAATAKKHSLVFYGNDPMVDNFWQFPPDSFHYYYLKMLLCRLPEQIRFAISARLLMIILREIVSKPATDFLLPYDSEKCKWTTLDKANQSTNAPFVTPPPVSPLLDPLKSDIFWNVVHPDNVYFLLKQFLARLGPPETRNAMCFKMLKSCIDYASDKDILAPYEPSKANHMPSGKSVPVAMTNGKTFILPSAKKEAETKNTQQNSSSPAEPSPEQKMVSDRPNLSSSSSSDESAAFVPAWMEKDCNVTSQGKLPDTAEIFRDIVWTRAVSELQLAENPNVPEDFDWASPPSEDDTSNDQACSAVDKSSSFDSTNFAWNRTPSYYYYRDSPLQLADVSGFSSSFDWTQPPSKAVDEAAGAANSASNGCTSSEQQPVDDGKHWLKTPTTVGAMPPRRLLSALEMIELPSEEAAVSRANTSCPATDLQSFGSIYSYIASAGSVRVRSCSSSSCLRASGAPVVFERLISTGTPPTASSPRADAATQTPPCPS